MADVFISYQREDRQHAARLYEALTARGYDVWWDARLLAGENINERILEELKAADFVLVIWSGRRRSNWVFDEAVRGRNRRKLLPVTFEADTRPPKAFKHIHVMSLVDWDGSNAAPEVDDLQAALKRMATQTHRPGRRHGPLGEDGGFLADLLQDVGGIPYSRFLRGSAVLSLVLVVMIIVGAGSAPETDLRPGDIVFVFAAVWVATVLIRGFHQYVVYSKDEAENNFFDRDFSFWLLVAAGVAIPLACARQVVSSAQFDRFDFGYLLFEVPIYILAVLAFVVMLRAALTILMSAITRMD